jgi:hypothetical protein
VEGVPQTKKLQLVRMHILLAEIGTVSVDGDRLEEILTKMESLNVEKLETPAARTVRQCKLGQKRPGSSQDGGECVDFGMSDERTVAFRFSGVWSEIDEADWSTKRLALQNQRILYSRSGLHARFWT